MLSAQGTITPSQQFLRWRKLPVIRMNCFLNVVFGDGRMQYKEQRMANTLGNLDALRQISQRTISTASRRQFENKVREKQKLFQEDDGIPVHLKGGVADALPV
ncbi:cytochrome c oxidase subunit 7A2, mitochondrial [Myotis lucifugus]|uniref:cytochrome c oxidase subunit 7A2, mitochondrial n=1 Tax=Myotis lucifugus TaxID=59463 RepID=UPI000CCC4D5F|nr:cytochrome c oxidase subunit 7A2, mitochondrial [Myotis lucifugus]